MDALRALVSGRVQGVGYRYAARATAHQLGLAGWISNTAAGEVEVFAQGEEGALGVFLRWLGDGPSGAAVHQVTQLDAELDPELTSFRIRQ